MLLSSGRSFLTLAILACAAVDTTAQVFRQRVDLISVDVSVTRQDEPVTDLSAGDFEVYVDGEPRRIIGFRRLTGGEAPPVERAAAPEQVVVLVLDRDSLRPAQTRDVLDAGAAFVQSLAPTDQAAVWVLPATRELRLTTDRQSIQAAMAGIHGTAPPRAAMINLTADEAVSIIAFRNQLTVEEVVARECGRLVNPGPACQQQVEHEAGRLHRELSARAAAAAASLQRLLQQLAAFDGPKHIVLISTGPPQLPNRITVTEQLAASAATARVRIHSLQVPDDQQTTGSDDFGRARGASSPHRSAGHHLADRTGGIALTPSNPRVGFRHVGAQLSGAYELGIEGTSADRDGLHHEIVVRTPTRAGLRVRARQQFTLPPSAPEPSTVPSTQPATATPVETSPARAATEATAITASGLDPATALPELVGRLGDYVEAFEREFSSAVATERYVQLIRPLRGTPTGPADEKALEWHDGGQWDYPKSGTILDRRQLLSDVLLVHTHDGWVGYRDVATVNGRSIRNREDRVAKLFLSREATRSDQLRRIAAESARYNLGGFERTLNTPTLSLSFLQPRHLPRFAFSLVGREHIDGQAFEILHFEERARPSLIGTRAGDDVPIEGRIWLDAASGVVRQTEIHFVADGRRGTVVTRYRKEPGFAALVPDFMWEWYDAGMRQVATTAARTVVECLARYSEYKRFAVATDQR